MTNSKSSRCWKHLNFKSTLFHNNGIDRKSYYIRIIFRIRPSVFTRWRFLCLYLRTQKALKTNIEVHWSHVFSVLIVLYQLVAQWTSYTLLLSLRTSFALKTARDAVFKIFFSTRVFNVIISISVICFFIIRRSAVYFRNCNINYKNLILSIKDVHTVMYGACCLAVFYSSFTINQN